MRSLTQLTRAALAALVLAIALSASVTASAQTVFDAVNDFSIETSQGVWSYGYTVSRGSQFVNYTQPHVNVSPGGLDVWNMAANDANPQCVVHNTTGGPVDDSTVRHPADVLNLHPGYNGEHSVVRWTASAAGMYQVKGRFQSIDVRNATTDVAVLHNSSDTIFSSDINGSNLQATFTLYVYVEKGDTVDFSVGFGTGGWSNDSTGLAATIKRFEISGRVTDADGNGIGGTEVSLRYGTYEAAATTTDENGRYRFDSLRVGGSYIVTARLTECESRHFRFVPESYSFTTLNDPQTADFVRTPIECPPKTICRDEPPCPL
jgi:hypothetical protein